MAQSDDAKRATTAITIAQLKFKQGLKKQEPEAGLQPVSAEICSQLFSAINAVLVQNTPVNIQKCTEWIVKHIAPSRTRIAVFGDYLLSISKSLVVDTTLAAASTAESTAAAAAAKKAARNRMDLLLVVNDALHTDKYHRSSISRQGLLGTELTSYLAELVELSASCVVEKDSQAERRLRAVINYWAINQLLSEDTVKNLRERADESLLQAQGGTPVRKRNYLLPEYHGDRTAPWYELPASYMLDQMIKQPNRPIDPYRIKVTRFDKKPVSAHVRKLLDNYFENIDLKHVPTGDNPTGETTKYNLWLDPMGQLVRRDKGTDETATVCNGYGWSMKFCQDMQRDGAPESIKTLREDAERMEAVPERQRDRRRHSRSPRRRRRSSSISSRGRDGDRRSGSYASGSSYDSRSRSRSRQRDRRRRSPRTEDRGRSGRDGRFNGRENDTRRPPQRPMDRAQTQADGQWTGQQAPNRNNQGSPGNNQFLPNAPQNYAPNFPQATQPPFNAPSFPPQPTMPNQFPGQFPIQPFPPPPPPIPFQSPGGFPGGIPPPPPSFTGPFPPPPPNIAAMPNNPYNFNNQYGNGYGHSFQQGNGPGLSQHQNQNQAGFQGQGYNQNQNRGHGGFQNGPGGYAGNQQGGGNYNNRGGYNGRGQRGGRWN